MRVTEEPVACRAVLKSIKQHLRIEQFYGTSEQAVKTQTPIAVSVYVLIAIVRVRLGLEAPRYPLPQDELLQVFSVTIFEKKPVNSEVLAIGNDIRESESDNQLNRPAC